MGNDIEIDTSGLMLSAPEPVFKKLRKVGPKRFRFTKKVKDKIYRLVINGATYHNQIYPKLLVSSATWYELIKLYPEILEIINQAECDRLETLNNLNDNILLNPTHKAHAQQLRHALDRHDRKHGKTNIDAIITVKPFDDVPTDVLLKEIDFDE